MRTRVVVPPAPIVSLAEAKQHLRVDWDEDDNLITALVEAAVQHIDGPAGWVGRSFGPQTLELLSTGYCGLPIPLICPPIIGIVSAAYVADDGSDEVIAPGNYRIWDEVSFAPMRTYSMRPAAPLRIRYRAGYNGLTGAEAGEVQTGELPFPIKAAVLLHVGHLYANREATSAEGQQLLPLAHDALLNPYRIWSI